MTFNVIASNQYSSQTSSTHSRTHNLTGSFLQGDIVIVLTMPNGGSQTSGNNYGSPVGFTRVYNQGVNTSNTIYYSYFILPANQINYSVTFSSDYGSWCMIVRGYNIKEAYVGGLPINRNMAVGDVILLPGGTGQGGFSQQGIGYDTSAQYSGAYREITSAGLYTIPDVTQYATSTLYKTALILGGIANLLPSAPTGLTVTNSPVPSGNQASASWTHNDPDSNPQSKYQIRWRKV